MSNHNQTWFDSTGDSQRVERIFLVSLYHFYWSRNRQKWCPFVQYERQGKTIEAWLLQFKHIGIPTLSLKYRKEEV